MLVRKNIMVEDKLWINVEELNHMRKGSSLSKIVNEALNQYIEKEKENNLAYKVRMIAKNNPLKMSKEEETEILETLATMTSEDMEIVSEDII